MPNTELDLWPDDIGHSDLVAPVAIRRQQASVLGKKTKNLVRGDVVSTFDQSKERMIHHFFLIAPALDDYRYKLFTISHGISFYPIRLHSEETGEESEKIKTPEAFQEALKKEFNSNKAKQVIKSMIAHLTIRNSETTLHDAMETPTLTRADVLALLAKRIRIHYGERLVGLYALRDDPYEPSGRLFALHTVALLAEPFDFYQEVDTTSAIADAINREVAGSFVATIYPASSTDQKGLARTAKEEGILL